MPDGAPYVSSRPAILVNGAANDDMVKSLLDIAVRQPEAGMASAELRMVNWGDQPSGPTNFLFNTVALGDRVEIKFGLAQQKTVFTGEVTAIEERYGDGVPQIVLLAEDALQRLARHRASRPFEQVSPNAIVSQLASDAGLQADAKLSDTPGDYYQVNESDLHFLRRLAARYAAAPRVADTTLTCRKRERLPAPVTLDAGDTMKRLRVIADLTRQPVKATVAGIDLTAGQAITADGTTLLVPATGPTAAALLRKIGWDGDETFVFPAPATHAQRYAIKTPSGTTMLFDNSAPSFSVTTKDQNSITLTDAGDTCTIQIGGTTIQATTSSVTITTSTSVTVQTAALTVSAPTVTVNSAMSQFSGVVQCDTLIANTVVGTSYTPGAGNIW